MTPSGDPPRTPPTRRRRASIADEMPAAAGAAPPPPETAEHWRKAHRVLRGGVLVAAGFLLGALVALAVVLIDPSEKDVPKHPRTVTVTQTQTATTTTEAQPLVPDVIGDGPADARSTLEEAGFRVNVSEESLVCTISANVCQVVDENPAAGNRAAPGTEVTISIDTP